MAVVLIAGTSHVGKSTLADTLGRLTGAETASTDKMGRHPGRPWPKPRRHVAEFFATLSPESILTLHRHHHENMWPLVEHLIQAALESGKHLVLEGAALRPEFLGRLQGAVHPVCLHAPADLIRARICEGSDYSQRDAEHRKIIEAFLARSLSENDHHLEEAARYGIPCIDTSDDLALHAGTTCLAARLCA